MPSEEHVHHEPESSAVSITFVGWSALGAVLLLALSIGIFATIYNVVVPIKTVPAPETFAEPRVDTHDVQELQQIQSSQAKKLESWSWADDHHTLMQVPIERAMQMLAAKGGDAWAPLLPPQPALSAPTSAAQRAVMSGETSQDPGRTTGKGASPEAKP
jgi:hypothetical protein